MEIDSEPTAEENWLMQVKTCDHKWDRRHGYSSCVRCAFSVMDPEYVFEYAKPAFYLPMVYVRKQYFMKKIREWTDPMPIQTNIMCIMLERVPCPCSWKNIFDAFKADKRHRKDFTYFLHFLGEELDYTDEDAMRCDMVDNSFDELKEKFKWTIKKKFNIYYLLYKIIQMRGGKTYLVPNKLSKSALDKYDVLWAQVCEAFGWQFIVSDIVKWDWQKEKILNSVAEEEKDCYQIIPKIKAVEDGYFSLKET
ncbi:hypothetical protein RFI_24911 [Reticulomyxa filosa]|uniref:Uncharacterized protein n=1 Tax=Reticulomyxa filosa TaxID=46433 RepID=X6MGD6_RETFI|nr:hypothetical protein RFI_24911 [Reticulomyxa filosa]|eukprot:ETO12467.1 hypothetical protein RFI_24911 [Reticulomyxa filosa]